MKKCRVVKSKTRCSKPRRLFGTRRRAQVYQPPCCNDGPLIIGGSGDPLADGEYTIIGEYLGRPIRENANSYNVYHNASYWAVSSPSAELYLAFSMADSPCQVPPQDWFLADSVPGPLPTSFCGGLNEPMP